MWFRLALSLGMSVKRAKQEIDSHEFGYWMAYYLSLIHIYSRLHRIRSDEIWHFYLGGPLRLAMIHPDGKTDEIILGQDIAAGQTLQYVVPAGVWFGATPCAETDFSFVGCTVAPGFDFADFEMGKRESLKSAYPKAVSYTHLDVYKRQLFVLPGEKSVPFFERQAFSADNGIMGYSFRKD